jgi:hypothetical protein
MMELPKSQALFNHFIGVFDQHTMRLGGFDGRGMNYQYLPARVSRKAQDTAPEEASETVRLDPVANPVEP